MPRDFLNYLPQSVLDATSNNDFASTVSSAMSGIKDMGQQLMQPIGQQIASVMPAPAPVVEPLTNVGQETSTGAAVSTGRPLSGAGQRPDNAPAAPFSLGTLEDWGFGGSKTPEAPPQAFSVGSPEDWGFGNPSGEQRAASGEQAPLATRRSPPSTAAQPPSEFNAYVRQASAQRGLDPDQVLKVVGKEGPTGWGSVGTFNTGTSYGPLQLHYAGGSQPTQGMGDDFTKATGIDLRKVDPKTPEGIAAHQRAVDFALDRLSDAGDYHEWYGADPALGSRFTKVKRVAPTAPVSGSGFLVSGDGTLSPETRNPKPETPPGAPAYGTYTPENIVPNQFTEGQAQGLSAAEAMAVCGPAAAVAFARANGRNPTLREAKELGSQMGVWDAGTGMHGPASQVQLLEKMGVPARLVQGADEAAIAREIQSGKPVTIDTPGHYYVATGYDPQTRTFEFGNSAGVLKSSKGRTRYRLDELAGLGMGAPRATIFMGGAR